MLRHYLSLALRNVARTKLYAAISLVGLAIGFASATLIGLYVHDELTYDRWLPNHERIYMVSAGGATGFVSNVAPSDLAHWLEADYPQLEHVARLFQDQAFFVDPDKPDRKFNERLDWADASALDVFRVPVAAGSLDGARARPDSLVVTRRIAEKYFGTAGAAVGKTLLWNGIQPMTVTAVIEDLPSNTHLAGVDILGAAHAPFSQSAAQENAPMSIFGSKVWNSRTYIVLPPGERIAALRDDIKLIVDRHAPLPNAAQKSSRIWQIAARPISALHLSPNTGGDADAERYGPAYTVAIIGLLILLIASINFVNLLTAIGARRALEVGVRKATGARRSDLFAQFMSESFLYVGVGAVVGLGVAAATLGPLDKFLNRTIDFSMFADWRIAALAMLFLVLVGLLAGLYPATVLSSFRPATVTKGGRAGRGQAGVRQVLVVLQFAILTGLLIATTVTYRQMKLGMRELLRQDTDPVVILQGGCNEALKTELERIPGVLGAACSMTLPQYGVGAGSPMRRGETGLGVRYTPVDFGFFELYGYELAAGRLFEREIGSDVSPADNVWNTPEAVVINETASRALGFGTPQEAIGETVIFAHLFRLPATFTPQHDAEIIGVLHDFQMGQVREPVVAAAFYVDPGNHRITSLKLDGRATPEALEAIDRTWDRYAGPAPAQRYFFADSIQGVYTDLLRQTTLFSTFAFIAVLIAVLGLVGLAAHAAASRTKEIGIRKTLGGGRWAITRLLLWQFARPVLIANVIAWPVAYWVMSAWLRGFATRVDLDWWMFVAAGLATLTVAVAAVLVHTWGMAGTRPVSALRYE
jgi:putative ABC transport system permease protein